MDFLSPSFEQEGMWALCASNCSEATGVALNITVNERRRQREVCVCTVRVALLDPAGGLLLRTLLTLTLTLHRHLLFYFLHVCGKKGDDWLPKLKMQAVSHHLIKEPTCR